MAESPGARDRALLAATSLPRSNAPEPPIEFDSGGRLLIVGAGRDAESAAAALAGRLDCHLLSDSALAAPEGVALHRVDGRRLRLSGGLGRFEVRLEDGRGSFDLGRSVDPARPVFDLVLDLGDEPAFGAAWPPPGAFRPDDEVSLLAAQRELATMTGLVTKPKFFRFDAAACAHGQPGTTGCRRCLDACPAGAIESIASRITVDPLLCQGGGACATTCPTGAISYLEPSRSDTLDALRGLIGTFRETAGGVRPVLVLLDGRAGVDGLAAWPERALPWTLHEAASAGLETWMAALALGAAAVRVLLSPGLAPSLESVLTEQLGFAHATLSALGLPPGAVSAMAPSDPPLDGEELPAFDPWTGPVPASKPGVLRAALAHLEAQSRPEPGEIDLPTGAPLGRIEVDDAKCTTCLSCAHACPTGALTGHGGDMPQLRFTESACVQCTLCRATCPEDAIGLRPRLLLPLAEAGRTVVLHEDEPFACVRCGAVFAPASTIAAVTARLADHPMFAGDAIEILKCCDDCRLKAL